MERLKGLYALADIIVAGAWGMTIIELTSVFALGSFNLIDNWIQSVFAVAGIVYLVYIKIYGGYVKRRQEGELHKEDLKRKQMENKTYEKEHKND